MESATKQVASRRTGTLSGVSSQARRTLQATCFFLPVAAQGRGRARERGSPRPCWVVLVLRVSAAPKGPKQASPGGGNPACGVGPGDLIRMKIRPALKGRNKILDHIPVLFCPLRALLFSTRDPIPRAVPWAGMSLPLRGEIQEAQHNCPAINRLNVDGWESPSLSIAIFRQEILSFPQVFCQPTRYLT